MVRREEPKIERLQGAAAEGGAFSPCLPLEHRADRFWTSPSGLGAGAGARAALAAKARASAQILPRPPRLRTRRRPGHTGSPSATGYASLKSPLPYMVKTPPFRDHCQCRARGRVARGGHRAAPEATLKNLVAREHALFADADKNQDSPDFDQENLQRSQLQQVAEVAPTRCFCGNDHRLHRRPCRLWPDVVEDRHLRKAALRAAASRPTISTRTFPLVKNLLGNYLAEDGRPLAALPYFMAAIKLDPREPLYHYNLGLLLSSAHGRFPGKDDRMDPAPRSIIR